MRSTAIIQTTFPRLFPAPQGVVWALLCVCIAASIGCLDESARTYTVTDTYEVVAGPQTGLSGSSQYSIVVRQVNKSTGEFVVENFANSYALRAIIKRDSVVIPRQDFPYYEGRVMLYGHGLVRGDTLTYEYFSGGPAGQIHCRCFGIIKKE